MIGSIQIRHADTDILVDYEIDDGGIEITGVSVSGSDITQVCAKYNELWDGLISETIAAINKEAEESGADFARQAREDKRS